MKPIQRLANADHGSLLTPTPISPTAPDHHPASTPHRAGPAACPAETLLARRQSQTIVENCSNTLILRWSVSENGIAARFASKLIGGREVIRATVSRTRKSGFFAEPGHSVSRGEQHVFETAVLPAEAEQLPDLSGYVKFASHPARLRIRLDVN